MIVLWISLRRSVCLIIIAGLWVLDGRRVIHVYVWFPCHWWKLRRRELWSFECHRTWSSVQTRRDQMDLPPPCLSASLHLSLQEDSKIPGEREKMSFANSSAVRLQPRFPTNCICLNKVWSKILLLHAQPRSDTSDFGSVTQCRENCESLQIWMARKLVSTQHSTSSQPIVTMTRPVKHQLGRILSRHDWQAQKDHLQIHNRKRTGAVLLMHLKQAFWATHRSRV